MMTKQEEIEIIIPQKTVTIRDCQDCPHHHCHFDYGYLDCSCDLGGSTCTQGIPKNCPLKEEADNVT